MDGDEHGEEEEQGATAGPGTAGERHQGRADDHPDGEGGGEETGGGERDVEVGGDARDEPGQHELGCALGEDREPEDVDSDWHG